MDSLGSLGLACGLLGIVLGSVSLAHNQITAEKLVTLATKQDALATALSEMKASKPTGSDTRDSFMSRNGSTMESFLPLST